MFGSKPLAVPAVIELKQFVSNTLTQIMQGVREARQSAPHGAQIAPYIGGYMGGGDKGFKDVPLLRTGHQLSTVEFDVTLGATEGTATGGRIGVLLGTIGLASEGRSQTGATALTRIRFEVPVVLPPPLKETPDEIPRPRIERP